MNKHSTPIRPAMTALAAVIALSSTSLMAQSTDGAASQDVPTAIATPVEITPAAPALAQTAAPEIAAPAAPVEAAPQPAMKTIGTPVVHVADAAAAAAPSQAASLARRPSASVTRSVAYPSTPAGARSPAPVARATVPVAASAPQASLSKPSVAASASATPSTIVERQSVNNDIAPIAGLAGLGALAIGGLAFAFRRKRREDGDELVLDNRFEETTFEPAPLSVARAKAPVRTAATVAALANGFDLSRFGPHVQAAYRGPTADNPFLSLRRRLSRARFYDQRAREAAEGGMAPQTARPEAIAARSAVEDNGQITVRLAPQRRTTNFGYAFQK